MKELQLTILINKELQSRYKHLEYTNMARLTDEAVANGYSVGILHYTGLKQDSAREWLDNAKDVVAIHFEGQLYKIGTFTDLSEVNEDKLYFAFKTKKDLQIAHSTFGCDSEGFIYNC